MHRTDTLLRRYEEPSFITALFRTVATDDGRSEVFGAFCMEEQRLTADYADYRRITRMKKQLIRVMIRSDPSA